MKRFIALYFVLFIVLFGCVNPKDAFEEDYPQFADIKHVFVKGTYEEVFYAIKDKEGINVVLFAYDPDFYECPFCFASMPIINEAAIEENIDKIIYLDIYEMRNNNTTKYQRLLEYLDTKVDDLIIRDGVKKIIVPDLWVVKDGNVIGHHIGTLKNAQGAFIKELNNEEKTTLKNIYQDLFRNAKK